MDTKWLVAAGVACVLAFGGALYLATPSDSVPPPKSSIKAPTVSRTKSAPGKAGKSTQASRAKAKSAKGGKSAKSSKTAKSGKSGKAKALDPQAAARKWDEMRTALADGIGAKLDSYATEKEWDDAKKKSVQTLLDDSLAHVDEVSGKLQDGSMTPEQAKTEFVTMKSDVARKLTEIVGAEDAMGLVAELKSGAQAAKHGAPTQ